MRRDTSPLAVPPSFHRHTCPVQPDRANYSQSGSRRQARASAAGSHKSGPSKGPTQLHRLPHPSPHTAHTSQPPPTTGSAAAAAAAPSHSGWSGFQMVGLTPPKSRLPQSSVSKNPGSHRRRETWGESDQDEAPSPFGLWGEERRRLCLRIYLIESNNNS